MQLLWAGRWCLRRVTFPSRARRGSRFEERVARRRGIGKAEVERALNAPRVVLNDRDYLLGAFSATAVIVGATKPWVATEFVYIADYPPPRRASTFGRCSARCPTSE